MKNIFSKLLLASSLSLVALSASAQIVASGDAYIRGDYVEVGVAGTGAFGACYVPTGYHNNVTQGCGVTLGFVSDPDKDGWAVSAPGSAMYMGDYFVPGSPYEGWDLQYNSTTYRYRNAASAGTCPGSACANISYTTSPTVEETVWSGTNGNLSITQRTVVKKDKVYFVIYVDIVNTGAATVNNVYYFRGLDPDNDQPWTGGGFPTDNKIIYQPNAISKNCLVTAEGRGYPKQAYLGLGTKDCRAKCCIFNSWPFSGQPGDVYNQTGTASSGYYFTQGSTVLNSDIAIGLVFNLGNLAPGQKTSLAYTYILKQADLDSALGETAPKFESGGAPYSPYTTFRVCPGKTVPLKVVNGGQYKWIWTTSAAPSYLSASGTSTLVLPGGTIPTVTGTKIYPLGAVFGDSVIVTVWGPKTYNAMGISNCDTQLLVFYVDTISFSVPPSVATPIRYCEGATPAALTAGTAAGAVLKWYTTASGGTSSPTAPTPSTTFPAGAPTDFDTTSYWVSQENLAGCETPRARIQVIVTKKPLPPLDTDLIYCKDVPAKMLNAGGVNLKWYDAATAGVKYPSTPTPSTSTAGTVSYFVSQTVNGCESDRADLMVETIEAIASFDKTEDSLCGNELLTLTNTSTTSNVNGYNSSWSFGDGTSTTDSNTFHSYADTRGTYNIRLIISTKVNACVDTVTQIVEVFKVPSISMTASANKICQGNAVDFQAIATPGFNGLSWDFGDGDPAFNVLQVRHAFTKSGPATVTLQGFYPACPTVSTTAPVDVVAIPNVNLGEDTGFCPGNSVLTLRNRNTIAVDKYTWSTGDTTATIQVRTAGQYSVKAQNWECVSSDSMTVTKACYLDIPNAFTPGSGSDYDGYFLPRELLSKSAVTFNMQIFDRWGQLIFETDKVNGRGWDGNYKGQAMPMGVYVYLIRVSFANGVSESYNGNLTLIR
ncbi:MAG: PKD domain-containing protein [Chitinophagaceae bacterium]|jgi:gliding motility-associated-like protein